MKDILQKDIIQPSTSPWASPIVLVKKKNGSFEFCIDYRKVNSITKKDAYPLPRVDETLDTLAGSQWFTTLDLLSGYWQVQLNEADREKDSFTTHQGLFEFKRMPFGLSNAPATFQRLMDLVLSGLQWSRCLVYLDDIIIVGRSFEEHLSNIQVVFQRLGLRVKPSKCELLQKEVCFLGHIVSQDGITADPAKTEKVTSWPIPTSRRHVQVWQTIIGASCQTLLPLSNHCIVSQKKTAISSGPPNVKIHLTSFDKFTTYFSVPRFH